MGAPCCARPPRATPLVQARDAAVDRAATKLLSRLGLGSARVPREAIGWDCCKRLVANSPFRFALSNGGIEMSAFALDLFARLMRKALPSRLMLLE